MVEQVTTATDVDVVRRIKEQVFERELGIKLAHSGASENGYATYLLARVGSDNKPVGSLCVLDTSNHDELHESFR